MLYRAEFRMYVYEVFLVVCITVVVGVLGLFTTILITFVEVFINSNVISN